MFEIHVSADFEAAHRIAGYKGQLIVIDGDKCKFGDNPEHFKQVTDMIDAKLYGLFPME